MSDEKNLRVITYLSPGIQLGFFETILQYLEEVTGRNGYLICESRWSGPPAGRKDPFTADVADIGFMESTDFLQLMKMKRCVELCKAGAVHVHSKNIMSRPVCYTDLIINARNILKYKELHDLRGHSFGFASEKSFSCCAVVLDHLKKLGFDASFWGNCHETGSHLASICGVLDSRVDIAAVDSNVLSSFLTANPQHKSDILVIESLGPLPSYPIVLNSKLSDKLKEQICHGLLNMGKSVLWSKRLQEFGVSSFEPIQETAYDTETELRATVTNITMQSPYY